MATWTSRDTETIKASEVKEGDRIMDPDGRLGMLTVWAVEPLTPHIWLHAFARRSVLRKVAPWQTVERCIPR